MAVVQAAVQDRDADAAPVERRAIDQIANLLGGSSGFQMPRRKHRAIRAEVSDVALGSQLPGGAQGQINTERASGFVPFQVTPATPCQLHVQRRTRRRIVELQHHPAARDFVPIVFGAFDFVFQVKGDFARRGPDFSLGLGRLPAHTQRLRAQQHK